MGSSPSCLLKASVHHAIAADDGAALIRVVRSTDGELFEYPGPVFVKDLMSGFQGFAVFTYKSNKKMPLHPETELTFRKQYLLKPVQEEERTVVGKKKPIQEGGEKMMRVKKVRFDDEEEEEGIDVKSRHGQEEEEEEEEEGKQKSMKSSKGKGGVRLKVVISKRQLTELLAPTSTEKQADALVEKLIAPLLSPPQISCCSCSKQYDGALVSPTWRPSLEHIPEDC